MIGFGDGNDFFGSSAWFLELGQTGPTESLAYSAVNDELKFFFQATFAAAVVAIVWGTMLDRVKFGACLPFAMVFAGVAYPVMVHRVWGAGWLTSGDNFFQDFAGAGVVHVAGAAAGLAGAMVVGPRIGKYRDGKPVPIPGHSMPLAILGVIIIWVGWQGFNAGSFLAADPDGIARLILNTNLSAVFGIMAATLTARLLLGTFDIGMMGSGAVASLGAIAGACVFVDPWGAALIGASAGALMVVLVITIDRIRVDDPMGAVAGHGGGIVGVLAVGLLTTDEAAETIGGNPGLFYGGGLDQLGWQVGGLLAIGIFSFVTAYVVFNAIEKTIGLRSSEAEEVGGLDITEHSMYGYPERFMDVIGATPEDVRGISKRHLAHAGRIENEEDRGVHTS
ncbi:MAG: ammonium transporter [Thermoleophilia bacterium]|nr:ammonium transporter [Thermoleophilia bacterium]MDH3724510.1 ammonium transporter [Thermoleophilia bacterium]